MFSREFKLKTLGVISSIFGWVSIVGSAFMVLAGFAAAASEEAAFLIPAIIVAALYFFIGVMYLGFRVLADEALNKE